MKKIIVALLLVAMLAGAGTVYAQQGSNAVALERIPDLVLDLFSRQSARQNYDNARTGAPIGIPASCDASGAYTVHYWRTADEVGATYLDGCIDGDVSEEVAEILSGLDMASVPESLLVTGQSGTSYTINLFCTGAGKSITITGSFAHCNTE